MTWLRDAVLRHAALPAALLLGACAHVEPPLGERLPVESALRVLQTLCAWSSSISNLPQPSDPKWSDLPQVAP